MKPSISPFSVAFFLIGGLAALAGTYWDYARHIDRGRDSFAIPPHLLFYGGMLVIGCPCASGRMHGAIKRRLPLQAVPIIVGIGFHTRTVVRQRNQQMTVQRNGLHIAWKQLPIDIDLPTG